MKADLLPHCAQYSHSRQYSLRGLLLLTSAVSLLLTVSFLSRGSQYFGAIASPWAGISLLPVGFVVAAYRWQLASARVLAYCSILCYPIALAVPALGMDDEIMWGWMAWVQSIVGVLYFDDRQIDGGWLFGTITLPISLPIACTMGGVANVAYFVAVGAYWPGVSRPWARKLSRRASALACLFGALVVIPMCLTGDISLMYPGFGLWIGSFAALYFAGRCRQ